VTDFPNVAGTHWTQLNELMTVVDVYDNSTFWAVNVDDQVFRGDLIL
jgi:hypothetical protein